MERAQARRLQPHFIGAFFREAFTLLGGRIAEREKGRFEILACPVVLKERDRLIGRGDPVLDRYARVTFEKTLIVGQPQAELVAPGPSAARRRRRCRPRTVPAAARPGQRAGRRGRRGHRAAPACLPRTRDPRRPRGEVGRAARDLAAAAVHPPEGGRLGRRRRPGALSRLPADHAGREARWSPMRSPRPGFRARSRSARSATPSPSLVPAASWPR